jgi:hypothetical protein
MKLHLNTCKAVKSTVIVLEKLIVSELLLENYYNKN